MKHLIFSGCHALFFLEDSYEMALRTEGQNFADLGSGVFRIEQHVLCCVNPSVQDIFRDRDPGFFFEEDRQITGIQLHMLRQFSQPDGHVQMQINILHTLNDRPGIDPVFLY